MNRTRDRQKRTCWRNRIPVSHRYSVWTDIAKGASAVFAMPGFVLTDNASRINPNETLPAIRSTQSRSALVRWAALRTALTE